MNENENEKLDKLLTLEEVKKFVPIGKTKLTELMKKGEFPKNIKLGMTNFWKLSEVQKFITELKSESHE